MTAPTIPELLQALANGLRRDLELIIDLDARLSADPCQCGPCTEARLDLSVPFRSRGVGSDWTPGCFVCGGENGLHANISGFVMSKSDGERVVAMFDQGARLDYRDFEPDWIQVKIGACANHIEALERLSKDTVSQGGRISRRSILGTEARPCKFRGAPIVVCCRACNERKSDGIAV